PYDGAVEGGDVHYVSRCAGGSVTRLVVADVSGHGKAVEETSQMLRSLMRRYINAKTQKSLVRSLNREFTQLTRLGRFATAVIATYLNHRRRFTIVNAGHPRPLWREAATGKWSYVDQELVNLGTASNLPLGIDDAVAYQQFGIPVNDGDVVLFYTDALIEAMNPAGEQLGEAGLLQIARQSASRSAATIAREVLSGVRTFAGGRLSQDDVTILAIRFASELKCRPSLFHRLGSMARLIGIQGSAYREL
ncbi:MAG TPA: PP2C family protein-serine/threonine phosphatase, partial [Caulifigura sp.]|nr:PP2C family protein-serine/threonine phosphatase [Caulifigura sp.]